MASKFDIIQRKELRGQIVHQLYQQYGTYTKVSSLINAFARSSPCNVDTEIPTQLRYLSDPQKGYVTIRCDDDERPELTPLRDAYVQLTATGCNLVEGDIDDVGIIFGDGVRA